MAVERVYVDRGEGRYTVLELAPQRRRCQRGSCYRLVDVPAAFCLEHERAA
jgi:hypothetical protein